MRNGEGRLPLEGPAEEPGGFVALEAQPRAG